MQADTPDGRARRALRGRQRVSEALVSLIAARGRMPTVEEVAERAGVGRRSVFRYFDGVEALETETAHAMRALITERVPPPDPRGTLEERLTRLVRHRERLYEHITPVRRFLDAARLRGNEAFDTLIDDGRRLLREHLVRMLAPELTRQPGVLPAVELLTSWEAWVALREGQRRSASKARHILHDTLRAMLTTAPSARATSRRRAARAH